MQQLAERLADQVLLVDRHLLVADLRGREAEAGLAVVLGRRATISAPAAIDLPNQVSAKGLYGLE